MSDFIIRTYDAQPGYGRGAYSMAITLGSDRGPLPPKRITARTTAEALAALDAHAQEAAQLAKPVAVSIMLDRKSRAPSGWRALPRRATTRPVNVPGC